MGIERTIHASTSDSCSWPNLFTQLQSLGEKPILRMIDGLPAFPDEVPEIGWQELRLGLTGGMVTIRRKGVDFACVRWGTSDDVLRKSWDRLCFALATVVGGRIAEDSREESPDEFAKRVGL